MEKYYSTGQFAKLAGVTIRTIRYYDKIGLLKPSKILDNGYRQYCNHDLITLQKILSLKELGFSLEEIYPLIIEDNKESFKDSLQLQTSLIDQKIRHLTNLKTAIKSTERLLNDDHISWEKIIELINLTNDEDFLIKQYQNSKNLSARIELHDLFSFNKQGWFSWLFEQIDFSTVYRLLEIGCGNGKLWENNHYNLRNREIFLSDNSEGMVEEVKNKLGNDYNYIIVDGENIPFRNNYFDTMIANHVLFYFNDVNNGLKEICRVLKHHGTFYCSTYSKKHLHQIVEIVHHFDSRIQLSKDSLPDKFGLENGKAMLKQHFEHVELKKYDDFLLITDANPLIEYIMSCHGNQREYLSPRLKEFKNYINDLIIKDNGIKIDKDCGLFICQKPIK
ncbi:MAG: MerR family transcriptional regulator [Faecalibacillus sp.]